MEADMYILIAYLLFLVFCLFGCAPQGGEGGGSIIPTIIMFGFIIGIVYLIVRLTNRKKQPKIKRVKRKNINKDSQ